MQSDVTTVESVPQERSGRTQGGICGINGGIGIGNPGKSGHALLNRYLFDPHFMGLAKLGFSELPAGVAEDNWVQTRPGAGWFVYLRLYGPEK
jgi:hypothetical protein